ncbi:MAG: 4Fe-4S dicluster domain-containing protein [Lentisphaerae bacterium]|nr:MAG: 4Fe-4S dicluster domain-containing protein [Lentisphaerota bacterium]
MKYRVTRGCTFCNTCVFECPVGAISMGERGAEIDQKTCISCGKCAENCASEAIEELELDNPTTTE